MSLFEKISQDLMQAQKKGEYGVVARPYKDSDRHREEGEKMDILQPEIGDE